MKKGIFKKILATVMTVAVMGSILPSGTADVVKASDTAVKSVTANHVYSEVLPGGTNIEYLYTVPSNGYFYITLTPNYYTEDGETSSSTSWWIPYTLKSKSNYKQYESGSAHYRNGTYQSENYCFAKGTTISFTTSSSSSSDYNWYYTIEFHQVKPSNYEVEGNGERKKASKIKKANKTYSGVCNDDDVDYWVFKAPSSGKYVFKAVDIDDSYSSFKASIYKGYKYLSGTYVYNNRGYEKIGTLRLKKGQKIYLKLESSSNDPNYKITVKKK